MTPVHSVLWQLHKHATQASRRALREEEAGDEARAVELLRLATALLDLAERIPAQTYGDPSSQRAAAYHRASRMASAMAHAETGSRAWSLRVLMDVYGELSGLAMLGILPEVPERLREPVAEMLAD